MFEVSELDDTRGITAVWQQNEKSSVTPLFNPASFPHFPIKFYQHTFNFVNDCYFMHRETRKQQGRDVLVPIHISKML